MIVDQQYRSKIVLASRKLGYAGEVATVRCVEGVDEVACTILEVDAVGQAYRVRRLWLSGSRRRGYCYDASDSMMDE